MKRQLFLLVISYVNTLKRPNENAIQNAQVINQLNSRISFMTSVWNSTEFDFIRCIYLVLNFPSGFLYNRNKIPTIRMSWIKFEPIFKTGRFCPSPNAEEALLKNSNNFSELLTEADWTEVNVNQIRLQ